MTKNDLQTFVAVIDAAQKAGIIAPDAMGLVYQARVSAINLANAMKDTDALGIVPKKDPQFFKQPEDQKTGILNLPGVKEDQEAQDVVVLHTGPSEHARPDNRK